MLREGFPDLEPHRCRGNCDQDDPHGLGPAEDLTAFLSSRSARPILCLID